MQRRNIKTNLCLTLFPVILCVVLVIIQNIVNTDLNKLDKKCGCRCIDTHKSGTCKNVCGIQYSKTDQLLACAMSNPPAWPPLLQVPRPENRAARVNPASSLPGLPELSCRKTKTCPATILFTGKNQIFATSMYYVCYQLVLFFYNHLNTNNNQLISPGLTQMLFEYSDMNWSSSLNLSVFTLVNIFLYSMFFLINYRKNIVLFVSLFFHQIILILIHREQIHILLIQNLLNQHSSPRNPCTVCNPDVLLTT